MFKRWARCVFRLAKKAVIWAAVLLLLPRFYTWAYSVSRIESDAANVEAAQVAIVYGAGLRRDGRPAAVLRDRLDVAVELYHAGKVEMLLMSGHAPEPDAMREYAIGLGVPAEDIWLDDGGLRTYDTCYRAVKVYNLDEAILVTQAFHLPRAVYLCEQLGLEASGVEANESRYWRGAMTFWQFRESLATIVALWEVHVSPPTPQYTELINPWEGVW